MRSSLIVLFLAGLAWSVHAQRTALGADLQLSFPQGAYKANLSKTGVGLRLNIFHRFKEEDPISIGAEIGFLVTGSKSRLFDIYYGGYYETYKVSASNNIMSLAFKAKADLLPGERPIQVFVESTVGTNLFISSVSLERETYFGGNQNVDGDNSKGYWAFMWGPGIGVQIPLEKRRQALLVIKASYLFGANTTYLTDPVIDNNGDVYFNQHKSATNMIIGELGVSFPLSKRR